MRSGIIIFLENVFSRIYVLYSSVGSIGEHVLVVHQNEGGGGGVGG